MADSTKFAGIIPPVSTLFTSDGAIDRVGMQTLIDMLIEQGVNGLFFLGTGGEFSQMTEAERREFAAFAVEAVGHRVPVLIGTGHTNMRAAIELSRHAEDVGADAVVAINPYYWKITEANLRAYFGQIADAVSIPVLIYNFPDLTGQNLTPEFIKSLVDVHPNIAGVKDTIDSVGHLRSMIQVIKGAHPHFSVLCGYDDHLVNTLLLGGDGAISASVNFAPQLSVGIYKAFCEGDLEKMVQLNRQLLKLPLIYTLDTPFVNAVKEAMVQTGQDISTWCLPPTSPLSDPKKEQVKAILKSAGLI